MNTKGILLLNYLDKQRRLNYCTKDSQLIAITSKVSNKVAYMSQHNQIELQFGEEIVKAIATIVYDKKEVKTLFDYMTSEDNNHFRAYNDGFVALKFDVK